MLLTYTLPEVLIPLYFIDGERFNTRSLTCQSEQFHVPIVPSIVNLIATVLFLPLSIVFTLSTVFIFLRHSRKTTCGLDAQSNGIRRFLQRVAFTFVSLLVMSATVLPYVGVVVLGKHARLWSADQVSAVEARLLLYGLYLNPVLDPFVYALTMPNVRRACAQLLRCRKLQDAV